MKLSTLRTGLKSNALKLLAAATLAGAVFTVATPAAQAQQAFVRFGGPHFYRPAPPIVIDRGPVYHYGWDHRRYEDWRFRHDGYRGWRR
jgi:hypothetical protein